MTGLPHADVLVIGAGAGGGVVARHCARAGLTVVCLEQGEWPDPDRYPGSSPEWELLAAKPWSSVPSVRQAPSDYPIDLSGSDMGLLNYNGVGGGTVLYAGQWPRLLPDDFRVRSNDGVADDWPLRYDDLQPYYERTEAEFGVSGLAGNPLYPAGAEFPMPPLPIGEVGMRLARAHRDLGWHWWPAPNAIASVPYGGRRPCVQRGSCGSGCNEGAKGSADRTHFPDVVAAGGVVVTGARVRRILLDRAGRASGAEWVDRDGRDHRATAEVVVVAANGLGTARLLLASAGPGAPDGLANSSGLVGRNLMLHPLSTITGVLDLPRPSWRAHAGGLIHSMAFAHSDPGRGHLRGGLWGLGSAGGPMRTVIGRRSGPVWGDAHHRHVRRHFGRTAQWGILVEDLPESTNGVTLSTSMVDSDGIPAPVVSYRFSDNTRALMQFQVDRARESLEAAGATDLETNLFIPNGHLMGTARMGDDPATSVVDPWCVSHDISNLVIADGSVFVTCGAANPTSTIAALASRAAERLVARKPDRPNRPVSFAGFGATGPAATGPGGDPATLSPGGDPAPAARVAVADRRMLTADDRRVLTELADAMMPTDGRMPLPSSLDIGGALLDRVIAARPDLLEPIRAALADPDTLRAQVLRGATTGRSIRTLRPPGRSIDRVLERAVTSALSNAYYLSPAVRSAIGYDPSDPTPVRPEGYPEYLAEGLLDHLLT